MRGIAGRVLLVVAVAVTALAAAVPSASAAAAPTLSVLPDAGLVTGQQVTVSGAGFAPDAQVALGECTAGATTSSQCDIATASVVSTDSTGAFSASFTVEATLTIGGATVNCAGGTVCVIGAGQLPSLSPFATAPIGFAAPAPTPTPPPSSSSTRYYLALGDSLTTGFGAPAGQGYVDDLEAYYEAAVPGLQVENLGCAGETTTTLLNGGTCAYSAGSQLAAAEAFLAAHPGQVALITIDVGGDDITPCASSTPPFSISASCVDGAVATVEANLTAIGKDLRQAAGSSVPIVGMTYYDPFLVEWLSGSQGEAAAQASVEDLGLLNTALSSAYASFGATVADVSGAFFTTDFSDLVSSPFGTIPKNVATACNWLLVLCSTTQPIVVGIHPNATGYGVIAAAYESALPAAALESAPPAAPAPTPTPSPVSVAPVAPVVSPTLAYTGFDLCPLVVGGAILLAVGTALVLLGRRRRSPTIRPTR